MGGIPDQELLLSTYVCHPSMANNELSGPVLATALARWISSRGTPELSYRILFLPETIGPIVYLSSYLETLRHRVIAGFVLTCVGDERTVSFMPSRRGGTLADRVAEHVLAYRAPDHDKYSFLRRGSDERQYCSPGVDLPVVSIMRSKYGEYSEYHSSADNLDLVTPSGLAGAFSLYRDCLGLLEKMGHYRVTVPCEPQLGPRGLYPTISQRGSANTVRKMMNLIAYADGNHDLVAQADRADCYGIEALEIMQPLIDQGLIVKERVSVPLANI